MTASLKRDAPLILGYDEYGTQEHPSLAPNGWGSRWKTQLDGRHQRRRLPPCSVTGFSSPAEAVMAGLVGRPSPCREPSTPPAAAGECYSSSGPLSRPGARPCLGGRDVL